MILLLLLLFHKYGTNAAPVSASFSSEPLTHTATLLIRANPSDSAACPGRSVWNIVWSCLATTFAVTWVSVHPNVPFLEEKKWPVLKRRIFLMSLPLLAPEVMIMWAFKQWRGALMIKESMNKARPASCRPWTMTHAHFLQMGGFKLRTLNLGETHEWHDYACRKGKNDFMEWKCVLKLRDFKQLLETGKISLPDITEEDIEDRSKGDALSKGVALLQITWFIIQLIARAHQHLEITEIELTTAALAGLNSVMYLFWWNKPFDVRSPIVIRTKELERRLVEVEGSVARGTAEQAKWCFPDSEDFDLSSYMKGVVSERLTGLVQVLRETFNWHTIYAALSKRQSPTPNQVQAPSPSKYTRRKGIKEIWTYCKSTIHKLLYLSRLLTLVPIDEILRPGFYVLDDAFSDAKLKMESTKARQLLFTANDIG